MEVPIQVADPLDVDGHDPARDGELGVVPPGRLNDISCTTDNHHNEALACQPRSVFEFVLLYCLTLKFVAYFRKMRPFRFHLISQ